MLFKWVWALSTTYKFFSFSRFWCIASFIMLSSVSVSMSFIRLVLSDIGRSLSWSNGYKTISALSCLVGCILFDFFEHKQHTVVIVVAETQPQATSKIIVKAPKADKHKTVTPITSRTISQIFICLKFIEDSSPITESEEFSRTTTVTPLTQDCV